MKLFVYSHRPDETIYFKAFSKEYGVEVTLCSDAPTLKNVKLAAGHSCISIITTKINAEMLEEFYQAGVRFISTRTIGYDHIDLESAKSLGILVDNVSYSPNSVAEYTVMLMLMLIRKTKAIIERSRVQDYTLDGLQGKELHNMTVGVVGTGRIGQTVIRNLNGFCCRVLAFDLYPNEKTGLYAEYVPIEELLSGSDIITLHLPGNEGNQCLINRETISSMKDGVLLVNTARGSLVDSKALIDAIESKKIGGAALDVISGETEYFYSNLKNEILAHRDLALLSSYPNVIMTPHTAFYTDQAVSDMVENSIRSCANFMKVNTGKTH